MVVKETRKVAKQLSPYKPKSQGLAQLVRRAYILSVRGRSRVQALSPLGLGLLLGWLVVYHLYHPRMWGSIAGFPVNLSI